MAHRISWAGVGFADELCQGGFGCGGGRIRVRGYLEITPVVCSL